jgi:hypothetical protein
MKRKMVIRCLNFGSLWWLRPGEDTADPFRFSVHAAVFNTTGFISGCRERRLWHISGVVRINAGMHGQGQERRDFKFASYESPGLERRGAWNRLFLGRRVKETPSAEKLLVCLRSNTIGRIDFDGNWHGSNVQIVAGSAFRGEQETLILASPNAQFQTQTGAWKVTWNGIKELN